MAGDGRNKAHSSAALPSVFPELQTPHMSWSGTLSSAEHVGDNLHLTKMAVPCGDMQSVQRPAAG